MDSNQEQLEWIEIADFSAGIHDAGTHFVGNMDRMLDGAATIENTYGCYTDRSGALCPFPTRDTPVTQTLLPNGNTNVGTGFYKTGYALNAIKDIQCVPGNNLTNNARKAGNVVVTYEMFWNKDGTGVDALANYIRVDYTRVYDDFATAVLDVDFWVGSSMAADATWSGHGPMGQMSMLDDSIALASAVATNYGAGIFVGTSRAGVLGGTSVAAAGYAAFTTYDTDVSINFRTNNWLQIISQSMSPDYAQSMTGAIGQSAVSHLPIAHQGRIVGPFYGSQGKFASPGANGNIRVGAIQYTPVLRVNAATPLGFLLVVEEAPAGVGVLGSLTADELLVVKHQGGGALVRGDLDIPQIVRLPYIASSEGVTHFGARTGIGFVYGNLKGIHLYAGGGQTQKISAQLEGYFWDHVTAADYALGSGWDYRETARARFGWWDPFVCVPNGYLYNTEAQSWWRLEDYTTVIPNNAYDVDQLGRLHAAHYKLTAAWNTPYSRYDWDGTSGPRATYSWQSQPIIKTRRDLMKFRQMELVATAPAASTNSRVVATLTGYDKDGTALTPVTVTFNLAENGNMCYRLQDIGQFDARYLTVKLVATSDTGAAPRINAIRLGYAAGNMVAKG